MSKDKELIVGIPLYNGCTLMDFAGATQVFGAPYGFKPIWLASEASIKTSEDVNVLPNYSFDYHPHIDILFVPGGDGPGVSSTMEDETYLNFLRKTNKTTIKTGSVCTGAFILAAAGLLHDCEATTYWSQIPTLKLLAEKMRLLIPKGYPRYLPDSEAHIPESKIFTGGGISSSIDLALKIVLDLKGKQTAEKTQLFIQYEPNPPVNSGDPSVAPPAITKELLEEGKDFTAIMTAAVEKLLQE
ncbi:cyclohexyl-isocyanide hydratase [Pseudarcicella hirudinis]|uniref:Cyclohexyl-isocyanide hydratase n=1 Tax=Pseudarcicella hirudinis TaxID=1079859 RepID=A0A1I5TZ44_9BACT|nr:DJ-1/PfpI family protein [Pseudarcicella hirudinis]SFP88332.1 cyclohexyl-isocyanide hydratase [Pseudarcicella hirudinis]